MAQERKPMDQLEENVNFFCRMIPRTTHPERYIINAQNIVSGLVPGMTTKPEIVGEYTVRRKRGFGLLTGRYTLQFESSKSEPDIHVGYRRKTQQITNVAKVTWEETDVSVKHGNQIVSKSKRTVLWKAK